MLHVFNSNSPSFITLTRDDDLSAIRTHDRELVNSNEHDLFCNLAISIRLPGHEDSKIITLTTLYIGPRRDQEFVKTIIEKADQETLQQASRQLQILSHSMSIKENLFWCYYPYGDYTDHTQLQFNLMEELVNGR